MEKKNRARLFDLRKLPMDGVRLWYLAVMTPLFRLRRLTPEGKKYKERLRGPAVVVANHTTFWDPFVMAATFWYRRMFWLAADVVMKGKLRTALIKTAGAIEIRREIADIEAIRKATDVLKNGHLLGVFPEGGIQSGHDVQAVKTGCVLLAVQAGAPIIPMYIVPGAAWYQQRKVVVGKTIDPKHYFTKKIPTTADLDRVAELIMAEMNRCRLTVGEESLCKHSSV